MIISYPYLPDSANSESEQGPENRIFDFVQGHGAYPASHDMRWHGGVHLYAQGVTPVPVRAIADGEVVAYRRVAAPAVYQPNAAATAEECDNSFVLLKHTTETGEGVKVVYYSLYMHLMNEKDRRKLDKPAPIVAAVRSSTGVTVSKPAAGTKVWRKDILGYAGVMYRQQGNDATGRRFIHFEIFTTDDDLKAFWHDSQKEVEVAGQDGSKELWGSNYYILPAKTEFKDKHPQAGKANPKQPDAVNGIEFPPQTAGINEKKLYVETYYDKGERYTRVWEAQDDGTVKALTSEAGTKHPADHYEYNLYDRASKLYPACPSAGYELLRFGRIVGPDTLPADQQANWQAVTFAEGKTGYVNLTDSTIRKLSDADFPHFKGWLKVDEVDGAFADDGICDALQVKKLLKDADTDRNDEVSDMEWSTFALGKGRAQLQHLVCRFPTEWDGSDNEKRFARLKDEGQPFHDAPDAYQAFIDHLKDLQFWPETGLPMKIWHFHPLEFIRHFRKGGWLSNEELVQMIPSYTIRTGTTKDKKTGKSVPAVLWEEVADPQTSAATRTLISNHRLPLNKMMRKYGVDTPLRQVSFLGNSIQETQWLGRLSEGGGSSLWYAPWYGRGFLQLTNPDNYCEYWAWRGRSVDAQLKKTLVDAYKSIEDTTPKARTNAALQDEKFPELTTEIVGWRDQVEGQPSPPKGEALLSPSDSAGFYWVKNKMGLYADKPHVLERHEVSTESGSKVYYRSPSFWQASAAVNLPSKIGRTDYRGLNGFDSRCCAYGVLLAVLSEYRFPNSKGQLSLEFPEGYTPRRAE